MRIEPDSFGDWLSEQMGGELPPAYELEPPEAGIAAAEALQAAGRQLLFRDDRSGGITFVEIDSAGENEAAADELEAVCQAADERDYFWADPPRAQEETPRELRSRLPESGWPVIGPGGRLLRIRTGETVVGQLVFRRRRGRLPARAWRRPPSPRQSLALAGDLPVALFGQVGYFEASIGEAQALLRPALVLSIDHRPDPEAELDVGWRRVVVEPITEIAGFPLEAGLDLWFEPGGVEDG